MSSDPPERKVTPREFIARLEGMAEKAILTDRWESASSAFRKGLEHEATRIPAFCLLSKLIIEKLFLRRESEDTVNGFLVEKLGLDPEKAALVGLMAVDAAKKAVDVIEDGRSIDSAVADLQKDHKADPLLSRPMIEMAVKLLESIPE